MVAAVMLADDCENQHLCGKVTLLALGDLTVTPLDRLCQGATWHYLLPEDEQPTVSSPLGMIVWPGSLYSGRA